MEKIKKFAALDAFRILAALLIISIHTSPLLTYTETGDFILTRIIARVAVPFFFVVTGYFLFGPASGRMGRKVRGFCTKLGILYAAAMLIYLPLNLYAGYFGQPAMQTVKDVLWSGTFYHLWYLPAVLMGVFITYLLIKHMGTKGALIVSAVLYAIGLMGDSYYGFAQQISLLKSAYDVIFAVFDNTRNGLFFAPVFLTLGAWFYRRNKTPSLKSSAMGFAASAALLISEGLTLHTLKVQRTDVMYFMLLPTMFFLFSLLLGVNGGGSKHLRTASMLIYILHPWAIVLVRGAAKSAGIWGMVMDNSLVFYFCVCVVSLAMAFACTYLWDGWKKFGPSAKGRAWAEIDGGALTHNVKELQQLLPGECELMAVVKANAYGHGDIAVARQLNRQGIRAFAVATLSEGIKLRKKGVKGEILVLGYTDPQDTECLVRYRLTQTVVDRGYAGALNRTGKHLRVHLKIDTGMHRLGVHCCDLAGIEEVFNYPHLQVKGVFSHLCVSDSLSQEDVDFTRGQINRFFEIVRQLREKGYSTGKLHIQASYGILNYPGLPCHYARAGIALYGVLSAADETVCTPDLRPVLSLRARVASVRHLEPGESAGYGRQFTASIPADIAVVTVGYADGIPRCYADGNASALVRGQRAPIVGRICMDQLLIDVTGIAEAAPGDIATIIGKDGEKEIRCEEVAGKCGTITNELLSGLGSRLEYIYIC